MVVLLIVLIPLSGIGTLIFKEASQLYYSVSQGAEFTQINSFISYLEKELNIISQGSIQAADVQEYFSKALSWIVGNLGSVFSGLAGGLVSFLFSIFILFYLFKDGDKLNKFISDNSPLEEKYTGALFARIKTSVSSVIKGSLIVALVQGIVSGIGFWIFGVPNPALWGGFAAVAALVPTLGTSLVMLPMILFLLFTGSIPNAFGLLLWGFLAVSFIDNLLGPKLMSKGAHLHPLVVLFGVLGGVGIFGPIGFIIGPVILSILFALLDIYAEIVKTSS